MPVGWCCITHVPAAALQQQHPAASAQCRVVALRHPVLRSNSIAAAARKSNCQSRRKSSCDSYQASWRPMSGGSSGAAATAGPMAAGRDAQGSTAPELEQVLFVEAGTGSDQHGQDATKAAVRACRNAIEFNSVPAIRRLVPDGYDGLKLCVKIGVPDPETVDVDQVKAVFPYGSVYVELVNGGLRASSGIAIAGLGDRNDDWYIAVAAVTVGY